MRPSSDNGTAETATILLIEDDAALAGLIADYLRQHRFRVDVEARGDEGVRRILCDPPDFVILDVMLPGMSGMDVCRQARRGFTRPILMLTARDHDIDQVLGLELGADDYVKKPVEPRVLLARIRALLRRARPAALCEPNELASLSFGSLRIERASRRVVLDGTPIDLTTNEFDLLWLLASGAGRVLTREVILARLRGIDYDVLDRSIDIAVSRLRSKLRDTTTPPVKIKTVRGKGYLFITDAW